MATTLLYRLFGVGRIPAGMRATLEAEGLVMLDEGVFGSATYKNFRAPQRYSSWRRQWFTGALALTEARLFGTIYGSTSIDVPRADPRVRQLQISVTDGGLLSIAFDSRLSRGDWSGAIEYRYRVADPARYVELLAG